MTVKYVATSKLPTPWGVFDMVGFEEETTGKEHVALVFGEVSGETPVLARVHSECLTGDALFSLRCDCGFQLQEALKNIAEAGSGVLLYLRQEGRGIGLLNKIKAYHLQDGGADTVEANEALGFAADMRDYSMCQPMLSHLGIEAVRLMTNNPRKVKALSEFNVNVAERVPLQVGKNRHNEHYLATKMGKLGHMMTEHHFREDD
ncbi:MAG: GTP cyclohydrolase II [Marinobacterium sp.]|nr:GTP cyclohydrolase II [Marinobacterium sp.]